MSTAMNAVVITKQTRCDPRYTANVATDRGWNVGMTTLCCYGPPPLAPKFWPKVDVPISGHSRPWNGTAVGDHPMSTLASASLTQAGDSAACSSLRELKE